MPTLDWRNRGEALGAAAAAPLRALNEVPGLSVSPWDTTNLLVHGDNLDALKALLPFAAGQVKCIYIDPPYNTGSAFEHYDDHFEHSTWLSLLYPRLELLRQFLSEDGSIWISIDDTESHYLKVICDEIFGRVNFVANIVWQQRTTRENRKVFSSNCESILVYARNAQHFAETRNTLPLTEDILSRYKNPDNDPRGPWQSVSINAQGGHGTPAQFYDLVAPNGKVHKLPKGRCWLYTQQKLAEEIAKNNIWFGSNGNGAPRKKKFLSEVTSGVTPETLWLADFAGTNDEAKKETIALFDKDEPFATPKPERLIQRILEIATNEGDLVLDSFLGSGTTAAVAHKMKRRWIGVEMGEHARTHCAVRLKKVVEGEQGGVSKAAGWKGGGGFRFLELGEVLRDDNGAVRREISWDVLAAHLWWGETKTGYWTARPAAGQGTLIQETDAPRSPVLGIHDGVAYALLYNGILKGRRIESENVLNDTTLALVKADLARLHPGETPGRLVVFAEWTSYGEAGLEAGKVEFRSTVPAFEGAPCN